MTMKSRDLHNDCNGVPAYAGGTINTNTATVGIEVDRMGYEALEMLLYSGTITDGTYVLSLQHSDVSGSGYVACTANETLGAASFGATSDSVVKRIGYNGYKRYVQLVITSTGTTSGGVFKGAVALLASPWHSPVADN